MAEQLEILKVDAHRKLCVRRDAGSRHPHFVMIVLQEFSAAASSCPIFFSKDPETGEFYAAALFGFQPGELLVEGAEEETAAFTPLEIQRQGFLISGGISPSIAIIRVSDKALRSRCSRMMERRAPPSGKFSASSASCTAGSTRPAISFENCCG